MKTGWVKPGAHWYYLSEATGGPKGAMMTGEKNVNGKKMNFANSGELLN